MEVYTYSYNKTCNDITSIVAYKYVSQ